MNVSVTCFGESAKKKWIQLVDGTRLNCSEAVIDKLWRNWVTGNSDTKKMVDGFCVFTFLSPVEVDVKFKQTRAKRKKKSNRGGKRVNAGRKPGEPTRTIAFRVPGRSADELKDRIRKLIASFVSLEKDHETNGTISERGNPERREAV